MSDLRAERYMPLKLALKHGETVAIDDIDLYLGQKDFELILFDIYQRLVETKGTLLVSHKSSALVTEFVVPDLGSRLRALIAFQIKELKDSHKSTFLIERILQSSFKIFKFILLEKKLFIELICVSPIPSIFDNSFKSLSLDKFIKLDADFKYFEINLAFSKPMCLIPKE